MTDGKKTAAEVKLISDPPVRPRYKQFWKYQIGKGPTAAVKDYRALCRQGQHKEALSGLKAAVESYPKSGVLWYNLGAHFFAASARQNGERNLRKKALNAFEKAHGLIPYDNYLLAAYGRCLKKEGLYEKSEVKFFELINRTSRPARDFYDLGDLYKKWGKLTLARACFGIASKLDPLDESIQKRNEEMERLTKTRYTRADLVPLAQRMVDVSEGVKNETGQVVFEPGGFPAFVDEFIKKTSRGYSEPHRETVLERRRKQRELRQNCHIS